MTTECKFHLTHFTSCQSNHWYSKVTVHRTVTQPARATCRQQVREDMHKNVLGLVTWREKSQRVWRLLDHADDRLAMCPAARQQLMNYSTHNHYYRNSTVNWYNYRDTWMKYLFSWRINSPSLQPGYHNHTHTEHIVHSCHWHHLHASFIHRTVINNTPVIMTKIIVIRPGRFQT